MQPKIHSLLMQTFARSIDAALRLLHVSNRLRNQIKHHEQMLRCHTCQAKMELVFSPCPPKQNKNAAVHMHLNFSRIVEGQIDRSENCPLPNHSLRLEIENSDIFVANWMERLKLSANEQIYRCRLSTAVHRWLRHSSCWVCSLDNIIPGVSNWLHTERRIHDMLQMRVAWNSNTLPWFPYCVHLDSSNSLALPTNWSIVELMKACCCCCKWKYIHTYLLLLAAEKWIANTAHYVKWKQETRKKHNSIQPNSFYSAEGNRKRTRSMLLLAERRERE